MTFGKSDHLSDCSKTPDFLQNWLWALSIIDGVGKKSHDAKDMSFEKRTYHIRFSCCPATGHRFAVCDTSEEM